MGTNSLDKRVFQKPDDDGSGHLVASFKELTSSDESLRTLLEGSHIHSEPWNRLEALKAWEDGRKFIASAIDRDGTILDYGSANGFLLRSLQEWSSHKLDPYGYDIDAKAIQFARTLFPKLSDHFLTRDDFKDGKKFPDSFDFVYWNVWDNYEPKSQTIFDDLLKTTKHRLIVGFYADKNENLKKIERMISAGSRPSRIMENPSGGNEVLAWFENQ